MIKVPVEPPILEYLHAKAARLRIPLSGTFELTPCCNMSCKMCYVRMTGAEQRAIAPLRTADEWIALGKEAKEQGLLYLLLTGGEPFLRPDFREIFQGLHQQGFLLSINSNGTLITEDTVQWLKKTPPVRINITLYGGSDETYARLCGNPKGYTQTVNAIRLLKEAGISIRINCSLTPHNAADAEAIYAFARQEGLLVQGSAYMFPPLRRDETMVGINARFTPEEAAYESARIIMLQNGPDRFIHLVDTQIPPVPGEMDDCPDIGAEGDQIRCRAGKCSFWITWKGDFMACGMMPVEGSPNVFEIGFSEAWKKTVASTAAIRLPARCASCAARDNCKACAAIVFTESGNYTDVPRYRCDMTSAYPAACQRLKQEILARREAEAVREGQEEL